MSRKDGKVISKLQSNTFTKSKIENDLILYTVPSSVYFAMEQTFNIPAIN